MAYMSCRTSRHYAKAVLETIQEANNLPLGQLVDLLMGRKASDCGEFEHFGIAGKLKNNEVQRIILALNSEGL